MGTTDDALEAVGTFGIWYQIISSAVGLLILALVMVMAATHDRGFATAVYPLSHISCGPAHKVTECTESNGTKTCVDGHRTLCSLTLAEFPYPVHHQYTSTPPTTGENVRITFDPENKHHARVGGPDFVARHRLAVVAGLGVLAVLNVLYVYILYTRRSNTGVRTIAGGLTIADLI